MSQPDKLLHILLGTERRVDQTVIEGVVAVIAVRKEYRGEVKSVDSQLMQVRKALCNAFQIAAVEFAVNAGFRLNEFTPFHKPFVTFSRAAEAVGHDLIPHGILDPLRRSDNVGGIHPRQFKALLGGIVGLFRVADFFIIHQKAFLAGGHFKVVLQTFVGRLCSVLPDEMVLQFHGKRHGMLGAVPALLSSQPVNERVVTDDVRLLYIPSRAKTDNRRIFVSGIAHIHRASVSDRGSVYHNSHSFFIPA